MDQDREQLKSMSFADMIRQSSTPENNLSGLLDALDEQVQLFEESDIDLPPLSEGMEDLAKFDQEVRVGICQYIIRLVKSGALSPTDIPNLVRSISYENEASPDNLQKYGASEAAMTWSNFRIVLHDSMKKRDEDGHLIYDIEHHFGHELGHSIMESGGIDFEDFSNFLDQVSFDFESRHILQLKSEGADPELIVKERFSEYIGLYLKARTVSEPAKAFIQLRANIISTRAETPFFDNKEGFSDETKKIFEYLDNIWPQIQDKIGENGFLADADVEATEDFDQETGVPLNLEPEADQRIESIESIGQSAGNVTAERSHRPATFEETSSLARKENHSEEFKKTAKDFLAALGAGLDIFGIN